MHGSNHKFQIYFNELFTFFMFSISLSVLSKKIKQLIAMLNRCQLASIIIMRPSILIKLNTTLFHGFQLTLNSKQSIVEILQCISGRYQLKKLNVQAFSDIKWLEHIFEVFIQNQRVSVEFFDSSFHFFEIAKKHIKELKVVSLGIISCYDIKYCQLSQIFPCLENLIVLNGPISKPTLTQNFKKLQLTYGKMTLDDLFFSNCSEFIVTCDSFSIKDLNILVRQWIRGAIPSLKSITIRFRNITENRFDECALFKEIEYTRKEEVQSVKRFTIERHDGTIANVLLYSTTRFYFTLVVGEYEWIGHFASIWM